MAVKQQVDAELVSGQIQVDRQAVEDVLLRALRARYPGRVIAISWDKQDPTTPEGGDA